MVEVVAGVGAHAGKGDGELCLPAVFEEELEVGGEGEGLPTPIGEAEEGPDADAAEATGVGAFGAFEAPLEIFLGSGSVEFAVGLLVVGFLIDDEALGAGVDELGVLMILHGADLDAEGGDEGLEGADAVLEVAIGDEFGVFAGDEEEVAEALGVEMAGFLDDLLDGEGGAEDGVVAGEAAVLAVIDALVGEIEGGEQAHGGTVVAPGEGGAAVGEGLQAGVGERVQMTLEALEEGGLPAGEVAESLHKAHGQGERSDPGGGMSKAKIAGEGRDSG